MTRFRTASLLVPCLLAAAAHAVQPGFRIHDDEFGLTPLQRVGAGLRHDGVPLSQLTTSGATSASAIEALTSWDFTPAGALTATETVTQTVPATSAWTCYLPDTLGCGFGAPDVQRLLVSDTVKEGRASRDVSAVVYDATTGILKGRATIQDEGQAGSLGEGEARLCLGTGTNIPVVPVVQFPNASGPRRYMQFGDANWQSPVFNCDDVATLGAPCRAAGGTVASLTAVNGSTEGRIRNRFVRTGTIKLPSGHVLDALLAESFTTYTAKDSACFLSLLTYRQWRLAWFVPHYGPIAALTSELDVPQLSSFTTARSTYLGYGLLPPVSIQATNVDSTSVTVSWNPGVLGEKFLDGYEVHWGTVSGKQQAPPNHSGPIPAGTTSYTITGLTPGQTVHVSVTTRRSYQDPVSGITTLYESIKLPQFIGSDADGNGTLETSYPPEIAVTPAAAGACVAGDIHPDNVGNGSVSLNDFVLSRRKVLGSVAVNDRDRSCGDVHPGAYACQPQGQPGRWCTTPNASFTLGDSIAIRRRVAGTLTFACNGCPMSAPPPLPHELRLAGDIAPRGATDGVIDVADAVLALRASVGLETPTAEELIRADVAPADRSTGAAEPVGDGALNIADVVLILRGAVSLETIRWPVRQVRARMTDALDFVAFRVQVSGWPAWAEPQAEFQPHVTGCDATTLDAVGDSWVAICVTDPAVQQGPADLFSFRYRGPQDVDPAGLSVVGGPGNTYVADPNGIDEPPISVTLGVP